MYKVIHVFSFLLLAPWAMISLFGLTMQSPEPWVEILLLFFISYPAWFVGAIYWSRKRLKNGAQEPEVALAALLPVLPHYLLAMFLMVG